MARAEFSFGVKTAIAARAGHRCSFPTCPAVTIGPSEEASHKTANTGMACHIYAASDEKPARRRNARLSPEQLASIDNAIWMCYAHGKLIDADEATYAPEILFHWRQMAELKAKLRQQHGAETTINIANSKSVVFPQGSIFFLPENPVGKLVSEFVFNACLADIWGELLATASREFLIEVALNAFEHGRATECTLTLGDNYLSLTDNGQPFLPKSVVTHPQRRGGAAATEQMIDTLSDRVIVSYRREREKNVLTLTCPRNGLELISSTNCAISISHEDMGRDGVKKRIEDLVVAHKNCDPVYLVADYSFFSFSFIAILARYINSLDPQSQKFYLVLPGPVSEGLRKFAREQCSQLDLVTI